MKEILRLPALIAVVLPISAVACDEAEPARTIVRDSAGIRIVENLSDPPAVWRLGPEQAGVGVADGPVERQLFRVYSGAVLDDGFVVANGGTSELRFYDGAGAFVGAVGREGEGPGEFRDLQAVWRLADSLVAYDFTLGRVSVFGPDRSFVRWVRPDPVEGRPVFVMGAFADGSLLTMTSPVFDEAGATTGIVRMVLEVMRHGPRGARAVTFGRMPWSEAWRQVIGDDDFRMTSIPFARRSWMAAGVGRMMFGDAARYSIAEYDADGSLDGYIRLEREPAEVTDEDLEQFRARQLEAAAEEGSRERMARMLAEMAVPDVMPAHGRLLLDDEGRLWVQDYHPTTTERADWHVFGADGHLLARITVPARFNILDVRRGVVLGHTTDALGVERAALYPLETPD